MARRRGRPQTALAARLRESREQARIKAEQMAEALGVTPAALYAWESGRNEPSLESLAAWAKTVGRPFIWLALGEGDAASSAESFADWVMEFADRVVGGQEPGAAYDAVTAQPEELSDRERRSLSRRGQAMRRFLERLAGREWTELSADEREALARRLLSAGEE